ncbi:DUF2846 domain-containing protein [Pseudomonas sp. Irchel s3h14]|uniref:DUF2846 domain-containing protein n=1 Tax=Pseudomonas sp. Irchel s3h14 TaxID=2009179 RepID=UPI001595A8B2|nr:DUF2846 domain-containing protein [Pseudomonas sp. Irchel s3h14]
MPRTFFFAALIAATALLQGCASAPSLEGQPFYQAPAEVSANSATVYFLRQPNTVGAGVAENIEVDGLHVGMLPSGGFFTVTLLPGTHAVQAKRQNFLAGDLGDGSFTITVEKGKTYFIANQTSTVPYRDNWAVTEVKDGSFRLEKFYFRWANVPQNDAEKMLKTTRRVPREKLQ